MNHLAVVVVAEEAWPCRELVRLQERRCPFLLLLLLQDGISVLFLRQQGWEDDLSCFLEQRQHRVTRRHKRLLGREAIGVVNVTWQLLSNDSLAVQFS